MLFWRILGWLALTVIAPVIVPVFGQAIVYFRIHADKKKARNAVHPLRLFKDGQLSWVAITLSISGACELPNLNGFNGLCLAGFGCVLLSGGILFALTAGKPVPFPIDPPRDMFMVWASLAVTLLASITFTGVHFENGLYHTQVYVWIAKQLGVRG